GAEAGDRGPFSRTAGGHRDVEITRNVAERSRRCEGDQHWGAEGSRSSCNGHPSPGLDQRIMTMDTERLIERMAATVEPVRPLARPWIRTAAWLLVAIPYVALVVFVVSPRADLISKALEWRYVIEQLAALATAITAATAAFATVIPGYDRKFLFLPALPLAIWLGSLGDGCVEDWIHLGPDGLSLQPDWSCFPAIVVVGAVPAIAMAVMLRRGAPLTPHVTSALGGLAAAGLGNFGLRLFHSQDVSLMVLVWQVGAFGMLAVMGAWAGRYPLNWRSIVTATGRSALLHRL